MQEHEDQLESMVARCVVAGDDAYRTELERLCAANPDQATDLRQRIARLEEMGLLGGSRRGGGNQWLPERIGGYQLLGLIGRGGMGVVFRGQKDGGQEVAIKVIRPDLLTDDRARERFRRESLLAARLSHPGICPVLEVGIDDDVPYLVMPVLQGRMFGAFVREQVPQRDALLALLESYARTLHAAHETGLVHRDVTPGNLFVTTGGDAIVLDFGLARDTTGEIATLTMSQELLGTLPYMSPEQIRCLTIDRRTDVYALGVVAYEALSQRLPFAARQRSDVTRQILSGNAPRLTKIAHSVPRQLERVVQTAMDPDPARRYPTALEFAEDLARVRNGLPVAARGVGTILRLRRWTANHPVASIAILLLSVLLAASGAFVIELDSRLRVQRAAEQSLASRAMEQADPMRAVAAAIDAQELDATPQSLGQLNRVLHQVSQLQTMAVTEGDVRAIAVHRLDDERDHVAVATDGGLSLLALTRRAGLLQEVWRIPMPARDLPRRVAFSPDGSLVACGGTGRIVHLVETATGSVRQRRGPTTKAQEMQGEIWGLHPDNRGAVWAADVRHRVWHWEASADLETVGRSIFDCRAPAVAVKESIRGLQVASGGDLLLWTFAWAWRLRPDGAVVWRHPAQGSWEDPRPRLNGSMNHVVQVDEGNDRVLACQVGEARILRWSDGVEVWASPEPGNLDAAMLADGTVATMHADGIVRIWAGGASPKALYADPDDPIASVQTLVDRSGFLFVGRNGTRTKVDPGGHATRRLRGGDLGRWSEPMPIAQSSDGRVLIAAAGSGRIRCWDFDGLHAPPQVLFAASPPQALAPHPDGRRLLVTTEDHQVWCWEPGRELAEPVGRLPFDLRARSLGRTGEEPLFSGFLRLGARFARFSADSGLQTPVAFDQTKEMGYVYAVVGIAALPNGRTLIASGDNRLEPGRLQILDTRGSNQPFSQARLVDREIPAEVGRLECLDASADGQVIAFGCTTGGLHLWKPDAEGVPQPWRRASTNAQRVWSVDLAADGSRLAASCEDGSVWLWNLEESEPRQLVTPRGRPSRCVLGDRDRMLIEFAADGLVRVWQVAEPALVLEITVGDGGVVHDALVFGGDAGQVQEPLRLATVSSDGWLRVWSFDGEFLLRRARERLAGLEPR